MKLLSSRPFWPIRDGLPETFPALSENIRTDVVIVGGGISGALIASFLASAGVDVVLLDRREVAHGSTAGNTGLLLYELDVMLHRLESRVGAAAAQRAYLRSRDAVAGFCRMMGSCRSRAEFTTQRSLYLAAVPGHVARLRREFAARRAAGLTLEWWDRKRIARESSLPHAAGIVSAPAATLDVYQLTYALLEKARQAGARVFDRTTVLRRVSRRDWTEVQTSRGYRIRATHLVLATGYEAYAALREKCGALHTTYALVSEPIAAEDFHGWPKGCAIWDTADPYLYLRTTPDGRVIIGGYDDPFVADLSRDRRLVRKGAALQRRFRQLFPRIPLEVATLWAGTFGVSDDGLPLIGEHPATKRTWLALGFGGNGTTFSYIAAEIIRNGILGRPDPDAELFGFARLQSR